MRRLNVAPNFSSIVIGLKDKAFGNHLGLRDGKNNLQLSWASPATIGAEVSDSITQRENSQRGIFLPEARATELAAEIKQLKRAKNTISTIRLNGPTAFISQRRRMNAAYTVTEAILEPVQEKDDALIRESKQQEFHQTLTHIAAALGHRSSRRSLAELT